MTDPSSFLSAANAEYIADLYARYQKNPGAVDASWAALFAGMGDEAGRILDELKGASWAPAPEKLAAVLSSPALSAETGIQADPRLRGNDKAGAAAGASVPLDSKAAHDTLRLFLLIRSYQVRGHLMADIDPLGLMERKYHPELDPATYGFTEVDYDRPVMLGGILGLERGSLREVLSLVQRTYCGTIGMEFMHIQDPAQKEWLQQRLEAPRSRLSSGEKTYLLRRLTAAEGFEQFLQVKYTGTKRFGIEGGETTVPAIEAIISRSAELGVEEVVIGMAHRGRLNVLANILGKSFTAIFSEFQGMIIRPDAVQGSGDVKYHLGMTGERDFGGRRVRLSLTPNPSHLEAADPVVVGKTRAKQSLRGDAAREKVMGLLIHGDAALAGQGVVAETLMMSELPGYRVGGTMHVVINNQIGFTTAPLYSRSGNYCTDVAKTVQAPVFHVNGDDVEAVVFAARLAAEFRLTFKKDVFLDILCYRRHGHNESDEPAFTQPEMYRVIRNKPTTRDIYARKIIAEGALSRAEAEALAADWNACLEGSFSAALSYRPNQEEEPEGEWGGFRAGSPAGGDAATAVTTEAAQKVGWALTFVPQGFDLNPKIARQLEAKKKMFGTGGGVDWATAEALAFGTLLLEGFRVRLSGQDCGRGTFSHRHAVLTDQTTEARYLPLGNIAPGQGKFSVYDSPLSENGVLGFEYGYSSVSPRDLVLWEAQFGDFANGAQVIIDQFIASAEAKWRRLSGIVLLLPHGHEGQGPEHSSARLERFLQLSAEDNWQVVNCSTPANYFHALRRQMHGDCRKPLIVMAPKSLLRHRLCVSSLSMMTGEERFRPVLCDEAGGGNIRRVVLCSGKVSYDLLEAREEKGVRDVALVRLEQLYPFPAAALAEALKKYTHAGSVVWCQEEPENQGAWHFVDRRIEEVLKALGHKVQRPAYAGRPAAAAPATGFQKIHAAQQAALVEKALTV